MRKYTLPLAAVTDTSGAGASAYFAVPGGGFIEAIEYLYGDLTSGTGMTIALTDTINSVAFTLFSKAAPGDANARFYPRAAEVLGSDGSALSFYSRPVVAGKLQFTVTGAGAGETGTLIVHVSDS